MEEILDNFPENGEQNEKVRHGCVTAWLILMIVTNSISALILLFSRDFITEALPQDNIPSWAIIILVVGGLLNVIFAIMLFQWKKAGFYGFIATSFISFFTNMSMGIDIFQTIMGLMGIFILYGILQIKQNNISAWDHME